MYLKRFFLAISLMIISSAVATPINVLQQVQRAHSDAVFLRLTCAKGSILPTLTTLYPAVPLITLAGALAGACVGIIPGMLSGMAFGQGDSIGERTSVGAGAGIALGWGLGVLVGLISSPFLTYQFWKKFFGRAVASKFIDVLANTSWELRMETLDYLNNQPDQEIADRYLSGDLYALNIFQDLLEASLSEA